MRAEKQRLEELAEQYPELAQLMYDDNLPREKHLIWQDIKRIGIVKAHLNILSAKEN